MNLRTLPESGSEASTVVMGCPRGASSGTSTWGRGVWERMQERVMPHRVHVADPRQLVVHVRHRDVDRYPGVELLRAGAAVQGHHLDILLSRSTNVSVGFRVSGGTSRKYEVVGGWVRSGSRLAPGLTEIRPVSELWRGSRNMNQVDGEGQRDLQDKNSA
jgi:hypothetical protein